MGFNSKKTMSGGFGKNHFLECYSQRSDLYWVNE